MVSDLLEASDKYQMVTLKNICQNLLSSNLEVENSLKVRPSQPNLDSSMIFCTVSSSWRHVRSPEAEGAGDGHRGQQHERAD